MSPLTQFSTSLVHQLQRNLIDAALIHFPPATEAGGASTEVEEDHTTHNKPTRVPGVTPHVISQTILLRILTKDDVTRPGYNTLLWFTPQLFFHLSLLSSETLTACGRSINFLRYCARRCFFKIYLVFWEFPFATWLYSFRALIQNMNLWISTQVNECFRIDSKLFTVINITITRTTGNKSIHNHIIAMIIY